MNLEYNPESNTAYLYLQPVDTDVDWTEEINPHTLVDYDADSVVVGIEFLEFNKSAIWQVVAATLNK